MRGKPIDYSLMMRDKYASLGLAQTAVWVPKEDIAKVREFAKALRVARGRLRPREKP